MSKTSQNTIIVSACLVGLCTRYDGEIKGNPEVDLLLQNKNWIPVCPEQLGGLPTPRPAADITGGNGHDVLSGQAKVLSKKGEDFTKQFVHGAHQVLLVAKKLDCTSAILKARSPSCAVMGTIGVTAALLEQNNITIQEM